MIPQKSVRHVSSWAAHMHGSSCSSSIQPYSRSLPTLSRPKPHPLTVVNPLLNDDVYTATSWRLCLQLTAAPGKTAGTGSPAPSWCLLHADTGQWIAVLFFFPHRRGKFRPDLDMLELVFVTKWACSTLFQVSLVRQCCCMFLDDSLCMFRVMVKISSWNLHIATCGNWDHF